jgi:hypothetical protein
MLARLRPSPAIVVLSIALGALAAAPGASAYIYYSYAGSSHSSIGRAALNGSSFDTQFIPGLGGVTQLAIDSHHIYWADRKAGVGRANINGTGVRSSWIKPSGVFAFPGVAVDAHHIYWGNIYFPSPCSIGRASLSGGHKKKNFINGPCPTGGLAVAGGYIYFEYDGYKPNGESSGVIARVHTKGGRVHTVVYVPSFTKFTVAQHHIYWDTGDAIGRSDLGGKHKITLVHNIAPSYSGSGCGVAIGPAHLYWGALAFDSVNGTAGAIGRANLNGSGKQPTLINGIGSNSPCAGAVDHLGPGG